MRRTGVNAGESDDPSAKVPFPRGVWDAEVHMGIEDQKATVL
jgi:hypothetical protein